MVKFASRLHSTCSDSHLAREFLENISVSIFVQVKNIGSTHVVFDEFYQNSDVPKNILSQKPLLMDPVNPYNNLLKLKANVSGEMWH